MRRILTLILHRFSGVRLTACARISVAVPRRCLRNLTELVRVPDVRAVGELGHRLAIEPLPGRRLVPGSRRPQNVLRLASSFQASRAQIA